MKKLALAALLATSVAGFSGSANAAGFDGGYLGVNLGWGITQTDQTTKDYYTSTRGVLGGFQAGWDKVFAAKWLLGAEAGVDFSGAKDTKESFALRAKLGYVIDNVAVGVIGGWKNTKIKSNNGELLNANTTTVNKRFNAFSLGGFMSTKVTDNVELGAEYAHDFYSKQNNVKLAQDSVKLKIAYKM